MITLNINQKTYEIDADPNMPLLWAIRDLIGLCGTKYGCGVAQCGACTVHLNGEAVRSCVTKIKRALSPNRRNDKFPKPLHLDNIPQV